MVSYAISATAITTATPERVLTVLDDFSRWPAWMPALQNVRVELPKHQRLGPGYRFRLRGVIVYGDLQVIDYTPLSRATSFRISFPPFTGVNRCRLVPLANGRHRIERVDTIELAAFVVGLLGPLQRKRFERLAGEFLHALKHEVEGTPRG
ncbi:MAG: SRPBCC family protein [Chloroflexales bacterium]